MTMTSEQIFEAYAADLRGRSKSASTLAQFRIISARYCSWLALHDLDVADVRRADVAAWLNAETTWRAATKHSYLKLLSAAYNYAVDELEVLERNPCTGAAKRLPDVPEHVPVTIPVRELRRMKAGLRDARDARAFHLLAYSGLRSIEIRQLQWEHVSLADDTLHVVDGKGRKSRMVPLHPALRVHLRREGASPWVLPGQRGDMLSHNGMGKIAARIGGRCHDYRRTVATSLDENDVRESVIDAIMGWASVSIRRKHYTAVNSRRLMDGILGLYRVEGGL